MLAIGLIRRRHGLSGEVSVEILTSFPERFVAGLKLFWVRGEVVRELSLASARPHGRRLLLSFQGVGDAGSAGALAGGELCVPVEQAHPAPPGFYYSHEIEGWECRSPAGRTLGFVKHLDETAAGALLTVETTEKKEVLVPFVPAIVIEVDRIRRRLVLDPPEGLLDL